MDSTKQLQSLLSLFQKLEKETIGLLNNLEAQEMSEKQRELFGKFKKDIDKAVADGTILTKQKEIFQRWKTETSNSEN